VSEVLIRGTPNNNYTHIHGVLHNGWPIEFNLPRLSNSDAHTTQDSVGIQFDHLIGKQTHDGWWVKAALKHSGPPQDTTYLLSKGSDYNVTYDFVKRDDVAARV